MIYNIYCDESNHLSHSENKFMILGYISCPKEKTKETNDYMRSIKEKHNLNTSCELKWTKVSSAKLEYYKDIIDYFFQNEDLKFRAIIADKSTLDFQTYLHLDIDKWYYRMYYLLLGKTLIESEKYNIYIDIKDTKGAAKIKKLQEVLSNSYYDFSNDMILKIQHVRSHETELLQLTDLFIGALGYKNNDLEGSTVKKEIIKYLESVSKESLISSTSRYENKFNLFKWEGKNGTM